MLAVPLSRRRATHPKRSPMIRTALAGMLMLALTATAHASRTYVYVSNADSQDISAFKLDERHGALTSIQTLAVGGTAMPMARAPNRPHLYVGLRSKPYSVATLFMNPLDGTLTRIGTSALPESMAYISTDATGRFLFGASYGGNLLSVSRIDANGIPVDAHQTIPTGPMAHAIRTSPDNRYAFASVLGADAWLKLALDRDAGTLTLAPQPAYSLPHGSGPRHFVYSGDGRFVYLIDELDGKLHVLAFNKKADTARPIQTISILPPDFTGKPWGADLHLTPNGKFLYVSERTSSTLGGYRVDHRSGKLQRIGTWPTEKQPRGFGIDASGQYLFAVGQLSNHLTEYRIDRKSGALMANGGADTGKNPNWIEVVTFK